MARTPPPLAQNRRTGPGDFCVAAAQDETPPAGAELGGAHGKIGLHPDLPRWPWAQCHETGLPRRIAALTISDSWAGGSSSQSGLGVGSPEGFEGVVRRGQAPRRTPPITLRVSFQRLPRGWWGARRGRRSPTDRTAHAPPSDTTKTGTRGSRRRTARRLICWKGCSAPPRNQSDRPRRT